MTRKALYVAIPYLLGFISSYILYGTNYSYLLIALSFIVTATLVCIFKLEFKQSVLCETSFIVGFFIFSNYMVTNIDYLKKYYDNSITFSGKVIELNDYSGDMSSYTLDGSINNTDDVKIYLYTDTLNCLYGDNLSFECTASEFTNEYLFNSKQYYNSKGVYIQATDISNLKVTHVEDSILYDLIRNLQSYRDNVISTFKLNMSRDGASLLSAILFGDTSDLSKSDKNSLTRSGIGHMVSVSGLHLVILTSVLGIFLDYLEKKDLALPKILKFLIYELFMLLFVIIVGFPISAVRTLIMLSISNMSMVFIRKPDTLNTLCIASMVMVSIQPYLIGNASFLLSVVGVYGIGVISPYITKNLAFPNVVKEIISLMVTSACILPICVIFFNEVSIISPITNILCLPLCEIALLCGFFVFLLGGKTFVISKILLYIADLSCKLMIWLCSIFSKVPFSNVPTGYDILIYICIFCVMVSIICYGIFKNSKYVTRSILGSGLMLFVTLFGVKTYQDSILKVAILGNTNCKTMIISYQGDVNIIDFSKNYKTSTYVQKYCKQFGITEITSITLLKKAYQSMVMYDVQLKDYQVYTINIPKNTYIKDDYYLLGVSPNLIEVTNTKYVYDYEDFSITVYIDGTFDVQYNETVSTFNIEEFNVILEYYKNGFFEVRSLKS